ncbi:MAG TPA: flagellar basal body-associated FliL family protein [Pilimelia sp.]|nr:flagellar basal body-associated FliL family protein [Pilimelia sp.]
MAKESSDEAPKKGKSKLIIMIIAVVFLAAGGVGGYLMLKGGGGPEEEPKPEAGVVVALDAITVNLADGHYLKVKMALQATANAVEEPDGSKALDLAIAEFTDKEMGELSSAAGRSKAKAELLEKVKKAYNGDIMDIYFTEFVMQ